MTCLGLKPIQSQLKLRNLWSKHLTIYNYTNIATTLIYRCNPKLQFDPTHRPIFCTQDQVFRLVQSHISSNEPIFIDVHRGLQAPRLVPSLKIFNHKYKTMDICVWGLNDSYQKPVILRHFEGMYIFTRCLLPWYVDCCWFS